jgi:hypothetical protein
MSNSTLNILVLVLSGFILAGCKVVGAIFGAGFYSGVFIVVLFLGLITFAVVRLRKRD